MWHENEHENENGRSVAPHNTAILPPYAARPIDARSVRHSVRWPLRIGLLLIGFFVFGFGLWASFVPLAGGAIATGVISPDGSRRTVQHLEGGIIRKLLVRDGDAVKAGQPLVVLDQIQTRASHDLLVKKHRQLLITKIRLEAERDGKTTLVFPQDLLDGNAESRAQIAGQRQLFETRREAHVARNRILRQRISQLREQIKGSEAQLESTHRQIELIADEVADKRILASKGYLRKPELMRMLRLEAELGGQRGAYQAAIAGARQQIGEARLQLLANDADRADKVASQLDTVQAELNGLEEKLIASKDVLSRTVITAPLSGTVVDQKYKTIGGVIRSGAPILDIVPSDERLLIDARVMPNDIDVVHRGLQAMVQLSALSGRSAPRIDGVVRSVSADRLIDESTGQPYYLARVEVNRTEVSKLGENVELVPGMPADVLIVTGQRTLANYILRPFMDAVWKTFRET